MVAGSAGLVSDTVALVPNPTEAKMHMEGKPTRKFQKPWRISIWFHSCVGLPKGNVAQMMPSEAMFDRPWHGAPAASNESLDLAAEAGIQVPPGWRSLPFPRSELCSLRTERWWNLGVWQLDNARVCPLKARKLRPCELPAPAWRTAARLSSLSFWGQLQGGAPRDTMRHMKAVGVVVLLMLFVVDAGCLWCHWLTLDGRKTSSKRFRAVCTSRSRTTPWQSVRRSRNWDRTLTARKQSECSQGVHACSEQVWNGWPRTFGC